MLLNLSLQSELVIGGDRYVLAIATAQVHVFGQTGWGRFRLAVSPEFAAVVVIGVACSQRGGDVSLADWSVKEKKAFNAMGADSPPSTSCQPEIIQVSINHNVDIKVFVSEIQAQNKTG